MKRPASCLLGLCGCFHGALPMGLFINANTRRAVRSACSPLTCRSLSNDATVTRLVGFAYDSSRRTPSSTNGAAFLQVLRKTSDQLVDGVFGLEKVLLKRS